VYYVLIKEKLVNICLTFVFYQSKLCHENLGLERLIICWENCCARLILLTGEKGTPSVRILRKEIVEEPLCSKTPTEGNKPSTNW
jgi:hypothetical protein